MPVTLKPLGGGNSSTDFGTPLGDSGNVQTGVTLKPLPSSGGGDLGTPIGTGSPKHNPGFLHFNDLTNAVGLGGAAHFIANELGTGVHDAEDILIKGPIGLVENAPNIVEHPIRFAEQFGKGVLHDFSPDRLLHHPLYALIDATALIDFGASLGLRAVDVGAIMARGGAPAAELVDAASAAKLGRTAEYNRAIDPLTGTIRPVPAQIKETLLHGRPAQERMISYPKGDLTQELGENVPTKVGEYARSATWRTAQKLIDRAHMQFPDANVPLVFRSQAARIGAAERSANIYRANALRQPAAALKAAARGLSLPEQLAIRIVAEGASIPERIAFHQKELLNPDLAPRLRRESNRQITLLKKAEQYIEYKPIEGKTRIGGEALPAVADGMTRVYHGGKDQEPDLGLLDDEDRWFSRDPALAKQYVPEHPDDRPIYKYLDVPKDDLADYGMGAEGSLLPHDVYKNWNDMPPTLPFTKRLFPHIKPEHEKLAQIVDQSRHLAGLREEIFGGLIHSPNSIGRKLNPLRIILGHEVPVLPEKIETEIRGLQNFNKDGRNDEKIAEAKTRLEKAKADELNPARLGNEELSAEHLAHMFRVPYATKPAFRSLLGGAARYKGGRVPPPSTVTHAFQGGYLKGGGGRNDIVNLMAESYSEAARFQILQHARQRILQLAVRDPEELLRRKVKREDIVAVNTDVLNNGIGDTDSMRQWRAGGRPEELTPDEAQALGSTYDALRGEIFKEFSEAVANDPRYVFIDRRLLGGLDEPNPLTGINARPRGRSGIAFVDALNNSVKAAILYLKPAYLFPNWIGNVALGLIHQGFAAPYNLYRASRLEHHLGRSAAGRVDALMGGGVTDVLAPEGGALHKVSRGANKLGEFYGSGKISLGKRLGERKLFPGIDDPSRRAAFYHEAQRAGFTTPEAVKELVSNPRYEMQAQAIAQRAAKEIIDYEDLGPIEQSIVRRVIFFYPWVKGATRYALHFAQDHSVALAATAQLAQQGAKYQEDILGKLPAYAEGLIPLGHKTNNGNPYAINPSSASILQTPGDVLESIHNLFTGHPNKDLNLLQNFAPVEGAVFTLASGHTVSGPDVPGQTTASKALSQLYGGLPLASFYNQLAHPAAPNRVYPAAQGSYDGVPINTLIALSRLLLLGGGTPRPINRYAAHQSLKHETSGF